MTTSLRIQSDLAIPPGEYLEEVLEELGLSKSEFARRMGRPAAKLSQIYNGRKVITPDTALQIEQVVGVPAHIWLELQRDFELTQARARRDGDEAALQQEVELARLFCYKDIAALGFVETTKSPTRRVQELRRFFGVSSLGLATGAPIYQRALNRRSSKRMASAESLAAWLRIGEIKGHQVRCMPFQRNSLKELLPDIRQLTLGRSKSTFQYLREILSRVGVALVVCPHLPKTYAHGAAFWLNDGKVVVMLTIRGRWADIFWFSLMHELGHVLLHLVKGKSDLILESDASDLEDNRRELEADAFARDVLIPPTEYQEFARSQRIYEADILRFARSVHVHPGVVVGRLQNDRFIQQDWHNKLRERFDWDDTGSVAATAS